jgi:hypothetical protein
MQWWKGQKVCFSTVVCCCSLVRRNEYVLWQPKEFLGGVTESSEVIDHDRYKGIVTFGVASHIMLSFLYFSSRDVMCGDV